MPVHVLTLRSNLSLESCGPNWEAKRDAYYESMEQESEYSESESNNDDQNELLDPEDVPSPSKTPIKKEIPDVKPTIKMEIPETTAESQPLPMVQRQPTIDPNNLVCDFCSKAFKQGARLKTHLKTGAKDQKCHKCNQTFSHTCGFKIHEKKCKKQKGSNVQAAKISPKKELIVPDEVEEPQVNQEDLLATAVASIMEAGDTDLSISVTEDSGSTFAMLTPPKSEFDAYLNTIDIKHEPLVPMDIQESPISVKMEPEEILPSPSKKIRLDDDKDNECGTCGKTFDKVSLLEKHLASGNVPQYCPYCNMKFYQACQLNVHSKNCQKKPNLVQPGTKKPRNEGVEPKSAKKPKIDQKPVVTKQEAPPKPARFPCQKCPKIFNAQKYLDAHIQMTHPAFSCSVCGKGFDQESVLQQHFQDVHVPKTFPCDNCDQEFVSEELLAEHCQIHVLPIKCTHCEERFRERKDWALHFKALHLEAIAETKYNCDKCKNSFKSQDQLDLHVKSMHKPKVAKVQQNVKNHTNSQVFNAQKSTAQKNISIPTNDSTTNEKEIRCKPCGKTFQLEERLQKHNEIMHIEKKHKCDLCDKRFTNPQLLNAHRSSTHQTVKKFQCEQCQQAFGNDQALKNHVNTHHQVKPIVPEKQSSVQEVQRERFDCDLCDRSFGNLELFKNHYKKNHRMFRKTDCEICGMSFGQAPELNLHLENGKGEHKCGFCKRMFLQQCGLKMHLNNCEKKHQNRTFEDFAPSKPTATSTPAPAKVFPCKYCKQSFQMQYVLENHIRIEHKSYQQKPQPQPSHQKPQPQPSKSQSQKVVATIGQCDLCPETFSKVESFKEHYKSIHHQVGKKTVCEICSKPFKKPSFLGSHLQLGFKDNQKCDFCGKLFMQACGKATHMKNCNTTAETNLEMKKAAFMAQKGQSKTAPAPPQKKEDLECKSCKIPFKQRYELERHQNSESHFKNNIWDHFRKNSDKREGFTQKDVISFFDKLIHVHEAKDLTKFARYYKGHTRRDLFKDFPGIDKKYFNKRAMYI